MRVNFRRTEKILIVILILFAIATAAIWHINFTEKSRDELTVAFLNVGQGEAIFVESATGQQILVDSGPDGKVLQELGKVMPWYDKSIDAIIITNPDKDHIAGFINVLERYKVSYVFEPGTQNKSLVHQTLQELIKEKEIEKVLAKRGMEIFLGSTTKLNILYPDRDVSEEKPNDGSIIAQLVYGSTTIMFTGDAPKEVESLLIGSDITSDVLKVGHHGSKTSTGEKFVESVNPKFAVISNGKGNKYGHPNQEVLDVLNKFSVKIFRTDELGTIVLKSDGSNIYFK